MSLKLSLQSIAIVSLMLLESSVTWAATVQVMAGWQNSKFLNGTNLTNGAPTAFIDADWSFDNNSFAGGNCYASSANRNEAVDVGCDFYIGYFKELNRNNAVSIQLTRHEYSRGLNRGWDFTDASLSWHVSKTSTLSVAVAKDWLGRPYDTFSVEAQKLIPLSSKIGLNVSANVMGFDSGAPVNSLTTAKASLTYNHRRWTTELGAIYTDGDQRNLFSFEIDQPDILFSIAYRLY